LAYLKIRDDRRLLFDAFWENPYEASKLPQITIVHEEQTSFGEMQYRFAANGEYSLSFELSEDLVNWCPIRSNDTRIRPQENSECLEIHSLIPLKDWGVRPQFMRWKVSDIKTDAILISSDSTDSILK